MKNNRAMMRSLLLLVSLAFLAIGLRLNADAAEALRRLISVSVLGTG
jgi:hypothetical protein